MPDLKVESAFKDEYHFYEIPHIVRVDNTHNPDARRFVVHFIVHLYQKYAPGIVQTDEQDGGFLNEDYRVATLRYCVGKCEELEGQEPSAYLDVWDSLGDHAGLKELRRRFSVSLTTDMVGSKGHVHRVQQSWVPQYNHVKRWARKIMWLQVGVWNQFEVYGELHREPMVKEDIEQERDGDFGIIDGARDWSKGPGLEDFKRDCAGRFIMIRPSMWRSED